MKKRKSGIVLILSLLIFIALLCVYLAQVRANKPKVVSKRQEYQNELLLKEENGQ